MYQPTDKVLVDTDVEVAADGSVTLELGLPPGQRVHVVVGEPIAEARPDLPPLQMGEKLPIEEVQRRLAGTVLGDEEWDEPACDLMDWNAMRDETLR